PQARRDGVFSRVAVVTEDLETISVMMAQNGFDEVRYWMLAKVRRQIADADAMFCNAMRRRDWHRPNRGRASAPFHVGVKDLSRAPLVGVVHREQQPVPRRFVFGHQR